MLDDKQKVEPTSENGNSTKHDVSGSLPFHDGFIEREGWCDDGCQVVVWEDNFCIYRDKCPIGCGSVWVLPGNDH